MRLIVGCRLDLEDFPSLLVYPADRAAYGRRCRLLSLGKYRAGKGKCSLSIKDVEQWSEGLIGVLVTDKPHEELGVNLERAKTIFGDRAYCGLARRFRPNDAKHMEGIADAARTAKVSAEIRKKRDARPKISAAARILRSVTPKLVYAFKPEVLAFA